MLSRASPAANLKQYQIILGETIWLTITRYDIHHAMSVLSQKTHYCSERDYEEAKHVLKYILNNPGLPLIFHKAPQNQRPASVRDILHMPVFLMGSSDSAHRSAGTSEKPRDQGATIVTVFTPRNAAIFVSSKVTGPSTSSCHAENNASVITLVELLDTYFVLNWMGFTNISQMILEGDNTSNNSLCTATTGNSRKKSRHFIGNASWVKMHYDGRLLRIIHTPAVDLVSNALTKRVTEDEQVWSTEDMRGSMRRFSEVDNLPHIPVMRTDHINLWPVVKCSATADYRA